MNQVRARVGLEPLVTDRDLNRLARDYLEATLAARCLCPLPAGRAGVEVLASDIAVALAHGGDAPLHAGIVLAYDTSSERAIATAANDVRNTPELRDGRMDVAGVAAATVPSGAPWLVPPAGGIGPEIDLTGYTLVVIITAGDGR